MFAPQTFVCISPGYYITVVSRKVEDNGYAKFWGATKEYCWALSLTWPVSMQIYGNVRKRLHKKRGQLRQDRFATPTWPPCYCFGTPIWPSWWKFFANSVCSYWLLRVHMTSNSDAVSRQNLWAGNIAKSIPSEGNSCYPWMLTAREIDFYKFVHEEVILRGLYNKSF